MDISFLLNKKPEEIINWFKSKGYKISWDWWEVWQEAHAKAFTVAKVMKMDILQDIREMVTEAMEKGIPFSQFKKELEPRLKAKGWWGRSFEVDEDGNIRKVWLGTPWRLKTIFQTNLQTAYMAGRYKSMLENVDKRPYWQYVAVLDAKTRPSHRILHGKVFRWDDPFWDTHFPPNGFNCRCRVRALSEKNIKDRNLKVEDSRPYLEEIEQKISRTGEIVKAVKYKDPVTGKEVIPDIGWSYNPGKATFNVILSKYNPKIVKQFLKEIQDPEAKKLFMITQFKYGNSQNIPTGWKSIGFKTLPDQFFDKLNNKVSFIINKKSPQSYYSPHKDKIQIGIGKPRNYQEPILSWFKKKVAIHEYSHALHYHTKLITNDQVHPRIERAFTMAKKLFDELPPNKQALFKKENFTTVLSEMKKTLKYKYTEEQISEMTLTTFDVVKALTDSRFGLGHDKNYFRIFNYRYEEFFASSAEMFFQENPVMKILLPDIYKEMLKIWTEMEDFI